MYWESDKTSGHLDWEDTGSSFRDWVGTVAEASAKSGGNGFLSGTSDAIPLKLIVRIESIGG